MTTCCPDHFFTHDAADADHFIAPSQHAAGNRTIHVGLSVSPPVCSDQVFEDCPQIDWALALASTSNLSKAHVTHDSSGPAAMALAVPFPCATIKGHKRKPAGCSCSGHIPLDHIARVLSILVK